MECFTGKVEHRTRLKATKREHIGIRFPHASTASREAPGYTYLHKYANRVARKM